MKKKMMILFVVIGVVCIGAVYCEMNLLEHSTDDHMLALEKPDCIKLHIDEQEYTLEADTKDYTILYDRMKQCWENSKTDDGKLEFVLLLYLDKEPEDTFKVTFYYEKPVKWTTMHGEKSGREIWANTYTFFPFDQEYSSYAIISEDESYLKDAFIIMFKCTKELRELLFKYY